MLTLRQCIESFLDEIKRSPLSQVNSFYGSMVMKWDSIDANLMKKLGCFLRLFKIKMKSICHCFITANHS